MQPEILVMDEPTAMLDPSGRQEVLRTIADLRAATGVTVVLITHHMDECIDADRLLVVSDGKLVLDGAPKDVFSRVEQMRSIGLDVPATTETLYELRDAGRMCRSARSPTRKPPMPLSAGSEIKSISKGFSLCPISVWSLSGAYTAPGLRLKRSLSTILISPSPPVSTRRCSVIPAAARARSSSILNGLLKPAAGRVLLGEEDIHRSRRRCAVRFRVGLVFQYPEYQLFEETVYRDIAFGPKNMGLNEQEVDEHVRFGAKFAGVDESLFEASPLDLSGGQKRRIAIAGVMAMKPEVLVLDEPMAGLDPPGAARSLQTSPNTIAPRGAPLCSSRTIWTSPRKTPSGSSSCGAARSRSTARRRRSLPTPRSFVKWVSAFRAQPLRRGAARARRCCSAGHLYPARSRRGPARREGGRRMLKDITLGQYFPGNTIVHRLDPRTKLIAVVLYIAALFTANN